MKDQKIFSKEDIFLIVKEHLENKGYSVVTKFWNIDGGYYSGDKESNAVSISLVVEVVENLKSQNR